MNFPHEALCISRLILPLEQTVEYSEARSRMLGEEASSPHNRSAADRDANSDSDTDFQARPGESDAETLPSDAEPDTIHPASTALGTAQAGDLPPDSSRLAQTPSRHRSQAPIIELSPNGYPHPPPPHAAYHFQRAKIPLHPASSPKLNSKPSATPNPLAYCLACSAPHAPGHCPLKLAGAELCPLCKLAHFGDGPVCPHLKSETQVRMMMEALKKSPEGRDVVGQAMVYLRGRKGHLVKVKKDRAAQGDTARKGSQGSTASGGRQGSGVAINGTANGDTGEAPQGNGTKTTREVVDLT